jgi:hypothetical protein
MNATASPPPAIPMICAADEASWNRPRPTTNASPDRTSAVSRPAVPLNTGARQPMPATSSRLAHTGMPPTASRAAAQASSV